MTTNASLRALRGTRLGRTLLVLASCSTVRHLPCYGPTVRLQDGRSRDTIQLALSRPEVYLKADAGKARGGAKGKRRKKDKKAITTGNPDTAILFVQFPPACRATPARSLKSLLLILIPPPPPPPPRRLYDNGVRPLIGLLPRSRQRPRCLRSFGVATFLTRGTKHGAKSAHPHPLVGFHFRHAHPRPRALALPHRYQLHCECSKWINLHDLLESFGAIVTPRVFLTWLEFDRLSRIFPPSHSHTNLCCSCATRRVPCPSVVPGCRMLIGACNPMMCLNHVLRLRSPTRRCKYGNLDIILDHFGRGSPPQHAPCNVLCSVFILVGC